MDKIFNPSWYAATYASTQKNLYAYYHPLLKSGRLVKEFRESQGSSSSSTL